MSSNNDNAMTRFLFAILRQKCLKDIDWNKVAHDPILAQEITNGHAARMRYSRFRSAMLGLEPQRRNRTNQNKAKVTKSKKDPKAKKEGPLKAEPGSEQPSAQLPAKPDPSPRIKQEALPLPPPAETQSGPPAMPAAVMADSQMQMQMHVRLLTPCSDSDLLAASQGYGPSPASDMLPPDPSFDFSAPPPCHHDHGSWQQSAVYSPFGVPYELDGYAAAFCEHQQDHHLHPHPSEHYGVPPAMMGTDPGHVPVKHEEWDARYH